MLDKNIFNDDFSNKPKGKKKKSKFNNSNDPNLIETVIPQ